MDQTGLQTIKGLDLSDADGSLVVRCRPAADRTTVDALSLRHLIDDAGFGAWVLSADALATLVKRCETEIDAFEMVLGQREDARFSIEIAHDGSCAWVNLTAARGGQPALIEAVLQALSDAGVVHGIDMPALQQALAAGVDCRVAAANASAPRKGEDTRFELLVADTRDRTPKVDEHGLIDYHELGDIPIVKAGQALMRRHPPTPGVDGCDVRGRPLYASPGLNESIDTTLAGAAIAEDDPNLLRAAWGGQPVHTRNGVAVEKVLYLKQVSMATGNVHFDGTVEVAGDVSPGMKVEVSGDIVVKGLVEGAQLDAGGSILVAGGVIAHGKLSAGQSVSARFVENSSIRAGTAIAIENMALHSDLQALNQVLVGTGSGQRGRLVGGSTRATMLVRAPWLGAAAGGLTKVQVAVNPVLEARCRDLETLIDEQKLEADKLEKVLLHLKRFGDPRRMLERVQAAWQQALQAWSGSLAAKAGIDIELALTRDARIEAAAGVDGDLDIAFGKVIRHLRGSSGVGAFSVDEAGRVMFTAPGGQATEIP